MWILVNKLLLPEIFGTSKNSSYLCKKKGPCSLLKQNSLIFFA